LVGCISGVFLRGCDIDLIDDDSAADDAEDDGSSGDDEDEVEVVVWSFLDLRRRA
jgi:hypothetical protein